MMTDEILAEVHRNRDELFQACGSDPDQFIRFIQTKEKESGQRVKVAPVRGGNGRSAASSPPCQTQPEIELA